MGRFDSVGAGLSRGVSAGAAIGFAAKDRKAAEQEAQNKSFKEAADALKLESENGVKEAGEALVEAIAEGASPEQQAPFRELAVASAVRYGNFLQEQRLRLEQMGEDPNVVPDPTEYVERQLAFFDARAGVAPLGTAEAVGTREGEQDVAEATTILGRDPTPDERQKLAGVEQSAPLISITDQGETALVKELGKLDANRINDLETTAQTAISTKREVARMEAAIESGRFKTGVFADTRQFLARLFDFAGVDVSDVSDLIGDAATADTLDAAAKRLGVEMAQKLGRITNMSLGFIKDSLPSLTRTPEGNKILIEVMDRVADRDLEIASLADTYFSEFGSLRPKDRKSFFEATRDLEESDPVIDEELRQRIIDGSKNAPAKFADIEGFVDSIAQEEEQTALPDGIPPGSVKTGKTAEGFDVYTTPDGQQLVNE